MIAAHELRDLLIQHPTPWLQRPEWHDEFAMPCGHSSFPVRMIEDEPMPTAGDHTPTSA
jgi:hypothetical protein